MISRAAPRRRFLRWGAIACVFSALLMASDRPPAEPLRDETVVVSVFGRKITYADIRMEESALAALREKGWDERRIRAWRKMREFGKLKRKMEDLIVLDTLTAFRAVPSPDEVDARTRQLLKKFYGKDHFTDQDAKEQKEKLDSVVRLLQTWLEDHARGEQMYKAEFADKITPEYWDRYKREYATKADLERYKRRIPTVSAEAVNRTIKEMARKEVYKERLLGLLRKQGKLTDDDDYYEWLSTKLASCKLERCDLIPFEKYGLITIPSQ